MRPKPPMKCAPSSFSVIEREVGKVGIALGMRVGGRGSGPVPSGWCVTSARPISVTRPPASGSPAAFVPSISRLARGSAARFWVCSASFEMSISGAPSGSVATVTSEA